MSDERQDHPTPAYVRTIFHLGLFGFLCLLFEKINHSTSNSILGLKTFLAAILPYYPAIWASRIKSRTVVIVLIVVVIAANVYLISLPVNPGN